MSRANPRFHRINAQLPALAVNAVRATFNYLIDNQLALWVLDYIGSSLAYSGTGFELAMATSLAGALGTTLRAMLSADCFFTSVKVQSLTTPSRMPGIFTVATANQPGTVAGNHIPSEMSAICYKVTGTKGQHGRGRLMLPGIPSSFLTPGTDCNRLNAAGSAAAQNFDTAVVGTTYADGGNTYAPGLTQRTLHGAATAFGALLTGLGTRLLLGTVRRRRIGRGK